MERAKLTTLAVERAHRSGQRMLLSDGDGLYLRKQTRDGASWTLRYHFAGREHWLTVGHYPAMSLAQARIEAREARVLLDKQQDPLSVRRASQGAQRQRGSFRELCEEWYRNEIIGRGIKHPSVPRRHLDKYLLPKLGRTAADVTAADIARVIDEVKGRAPTAANDLLRFAHRLSDRAKPKPIAGALAHEVAEHGRRLPWSHVTLGHLLLDHEAQALADRKPIGLRARPQRATVQGALRIRLQLQPLTAPFNGEIAKGKRCRWLAPHGLPESLLLDHEPQIPRDG
jgi:Arm DNA-binding domain